MILAFLAFAAQPAPVPEPSAVENAFLSICWRELAGPAALRRAIQRSPLGFTRGPDENGFEIYRAAAATLRFKPGEGCEFEAELPTRTHGEAILARVAAAVGLPPPQGSVNHPGTAARYYWDRPAQAGRRGLAAILSYGRPVGGRDRPARLSLWAYLASGQ
jgi:hypothetical protein